MTTSRRGLGGLLSRPAYQRLWLARTVSQVGDVAQFTTLALLLVALTGRPRHRGLAAGAVGRVRLY